MRFLKFLKQLYTRALDPIWFWLGVGTILSNYWPVIKRLAEGGSVRGMPRSAFGEVEILVIQGGSTILLSLFGMLMDGRVKTFLRHLLFLGFLMPLLFMAQWPWIGGSPFALLLAGLPAGLVLLGIWFFLTGTDHPDPDRPYPGWLRFSTLAFKTVIGLIYTAYLAIGDSTDGLLLMGGALLLSTAVFSVSLYFRYGTRPRSIARGHILLGVLIIAAGYGIPFFNTGGIRTGESAVITGAGLIFILIGLFIGRLGKSDATAG